MLSQAEEQLLGHYFMKKLLEFCNVFEPRVPRSAVVGLLAWSNTDVFFLYAFLFCSIQATAAAYFKRFYLNTSVMEYNPRQIL